MKPEMENVILGTVQFGLHYGVSNIIGKTQKQEVKKILSSAYELGIRELDTAPVYGDSEEVLSEVMLDCFKVNTKLIALNGGGKNEILQKLNKSIEIFGGGIYSVAVHNVKDVLSPDFKVVVEEIEFLKNKGKIHRFGISVYNPEDLELVRVFKPDFIQLPFNIYDQRFIDNPIIDELRFNGCEIHARSIFLQGLLLMSENEIPDRLKSIKPNIKALTDYSIKKESTIYDMCLYWASSQKWIDKIVVGINDINQLGMLEKTINRISVNDDLYNLTSFRIDDPLVVNPANWT